jgi:biopolymer transport protein ExbB
MTHMPKGMMILLAGIWLGVAARPCAAQESAAPAGGGGTSLEEVWTLLVDQYHAGGKTNSCIALLSVLGLALILERAFRLRKRVIAPTGLAKDADRLWKEGKYDEILALCSKRRRSILSDIVRYLVECRGMNLADVNQAVCDMADSGMSRHHILAYPMTGVAALAPLLGLFGTVLGMMECFQTVAVAGAMGDPSLLAEGIAKALVTTSWGLLVAIPAVFAFTLIKFRTKYLGQLLEEEVNMLLQSWFSKKESRP